MIRLQIKLTKIRIKNNLTTDELGIAVRKIFKRKLQVTKNKNAILMEELRLYIIANDKYNKIKNVYHYEVTESEKKYLDNYDNEKTEKIVAEKELKELVVKLQKEKEKNPNQIILVK